MLNELLYGLGALQFILLILLVFELAASARERRSLRRLLRVLGERPLEALLSQTTDSVEAFGHQIRALEHQVSELMDYAAQCYSRVGMVRFDAFPDLGGQLSYAVALVDARGDGLLIRSLHGRTESSLAFKQIRQGVADGRVLPEEQQALEQALGGLP
jgi:hypothetical protein